MATEDQPGVSTGGRRVHAATRQVQETMKHAYREFAEFFRTAAQELRNGITDP